MESGSSVISPPGTPAKPAGAYQQIKDLIVTLQLRPGMTIREEDLQQRLGVGRTPIREALIRLAADGMLHIHPRRAIVVSKLGVAEVQQLFEMRVVTEPSAAAFAAERASAGEIETLQRLGSELETSRSRIDPLQFLNIDHRFHRAIATASRNTFLSASVERLLTLNLWLWHSYFDAVGTSGEDMFTHEFIVDAISSRDPEAAMTAMREHILCSKTQLLTGF